MPPKEPYSDPYGQSDNPNGYNFGSDSFPVNGGDAGMGDWGDSGGNSNKQGDMSSGASGYGGIVTQNAEAGWNFGRRIGGMFQGAQQFSDARKGLYALSQIKRPEYGRSPEFQNAYTSSLAAYQKSLAMKAQGYSPEEIAAYHQNQAQSSNTAAKRGIAMSGGSLAGAINASIGAQNLGSNNKFYSADAAMRNSNEYRNLAIQQHNLGQMSSLARGLQSQDNLKTQADLNYRNMQEQAYGRALSEGRQNMLG